MIIFTRILFVVIVGLIMFGGVIPYLISAKDSVYVAIGLFLFIGVVYWGYFFIEDTFIDKDDYFNRQIEKMKKRLGR